MTPITFVACAAVALGVWCAAVGGSVLVYGVVGAWQDRTSPTLLRWWVETTALAAVTVAAGAGLAVWAANLAGVLP